VLPQILRVGRDVGLSVRARPGRMRIVDRPETRYAVTDDGVHIAYQLQGVPDRSRFFGMTS
jgi:hypothetical protein